MMVGTCLGTGSSSVLDGGDGVMMVVATAEVVMGGDDVGRDSRQRCESGEVSTVSRSQGKGFEGEGSGIGRGTQGEGVKGEFENPRDCEAAEGS